MSLGRCAQSGNSYVPHARAILQRYGYPPRPPAPGSRGARSGRVSWGSSCDTVGAPVSRQAMNHPSIKALGAGSREDFEADVVLRDGSTVRVRAVRTADESPLLEFLRDLSTAFPHSQIWRRGERLLPASGGGTVSEGRQRARPGADRHERARPAHHRARDVCGDRPRSRGSRVRNRGHVSASGVGHDIAGGIGPGRLFPRHPSLRGDRPPPEPPDGGASFGIPGSRFRSMPPRTKSSSSSRPR